MIKPRTRSQQVNRVKVARASHSSTGATVHTQVRNISILCENLHSHLLEGHWSPPRHPAEGGADTTHPATTDGDSLTWWWSKDKKPATASSNRKGDEKGMGRLRTWSNLRPRR